MCEFKITFKEKVTKDTAVIKKSAYIATSDDFEAVVTVAEHRKTQPYVSSIVCVKGEQKLIGFHFWNQLQIETLKTHNNGK